MLPDVPPPRRSSAVLSNAAHCRDLYAPAHRGHPTRGGILVAPPGAESRCEMSDRRRTNRFVIPEYGRATFRMMQDVFIEGLDGDLVGMMSHYSLRIGEELLLELPPALGVRAILPVTVTSCGPSWNGDTARYRAVARSPEVVNRRPLTGADTRVARRQPLVPAIGVLIRRVAVQVRDVSTSGCLLESQDALADGGVGQLEIAVDGELQQEPLRICRTARVTGSPWPWRSGAHFLSIDAPAPASVRNIVARLEIIDELYRRQPQHGLPAPHP
jgi:hypothetical protein